MYTQKAPMTLISILVIFITTNISPSLSMFSYGRYININVFKDANKDKTRRNQKQSRTDRNKQELTVLSKSVRTKTPPLLFLELGPVPPVGK